MDTDARNKLFITSLYQLRINLLTEKLIFFFPRYPSLCGVCYSARSDRIKSTEKLFIIIIRIEDDTSAGGGFMIYVNIFDEVC